MKYGQTSKMTTCTLGKPETDDLTKHENLVTLKLTKMKSG